MNFPKEIIEELLFRLPVKSLMKFKCVSKEWNRTISSNNFRRHYRSKQQCRSTAPTGFICHADPSDYFFEDIQKKIFLYASEDYDEKQELKSLDYLKEFSVIASSKGILLLNNEFKSLCVYDLVSRKQVNLPTISEVESPFFSVSFGFKCEEENSVPKSDHYRGFRYKVVVIKRGNYIDGLCSIWIYSSETMTWQRSFMKAKSILRIRGSAPAKVIGGVFHWHSCNERIIAYDSDDPSGHVVIIELPMSLSLIIPYSERSKGLEATKDGSLQLIYTEGMIMDVWILNTGGKSYMNESIVDAGKWSLVHRVNLLDICRFQDLSPRHPNMRCIGINPVDAGIIYLEIQRRLYAYNHHEGKVVFTSSQKIPSDICHYKEQHIFIHIEWPMWPCL